MCRPGSAGGKRRGRGQFRGESPDQAGDRLRLLQVDGMRRPGTERGLPPGAQRSDALRQSAVLGVAGAGDEQRRAPQLRQGIPERGLAGD